MFASEPPDPVAEGLLVISSCYNLCFGYDGFYETLGRKLKDPPVFFFLFPPAHLLNEFGDEMFGDEIRFWHAVLIRRDG